jgi:hypothetical protein
MASNPFDPQDFQEGPQPIEKQGMSGGSKVLLILGIIFLVLILLCCGGLAVFFFYARSYVGEAMSTDPAHIREVTARVAPLEVPDVLKPQFSMDMKVPFTDTSAMTMVAYSDPSQESMLMLAAFGEAFQGQNQAQMEAQMQQSLRSQGMNQRGDMTINERSEREIEVRGKPVTFHFAKGTQKDSQTGAETPRIEVTGMFEGPEGMVMLMVQADEETLSEDEIVEMIESIK